MQLIKKSEQAARDGALNSRSEAARRLLCVCVAGIKALSVQASRLEPGDETTSISLSRVVASISSAVFTSTRILKKLDRKLLDVSKMRMAAGWSTEDYVLIS